MLFSVKARKPRPHSLGAISGAWNAFSVSNFCLKFLSLILVSMFYCYSASILDRILVDSIFFKSTYLILLLLIGGAPLKKQPALFLPPLLLPSLPPLIGNPLATWREGIWLAWLSPPFPVVSVPAESLPSDL